MEINSSIQKSRRIFLKVAGNPADILSVEKNQWGIVLNDLEVDPARYSLVFDGVSDDNPETLQKLKGVFIADLDLSVPEVQQILELGRGVVCAADEEEVLTQKLLLLQKAGANAHIHRPDQLEAFELDEEGAELAFNESENPFAAFAAEEDDLEGQEQVALTDDYADQGFESDEPDAQDEVEDEEDAEEHDEEEDDEDDEDDEFELELSFDEMFEAPRPKKKRTTVHVISDDSLSLDDTLSELGLEPDEPVAQPDKEQDQAAFLTADADLDLSPSLEPESHPLNRAETDVAEELNLTAPALPDTDSLSFDAPASPEPPSVPHRTAATPKVNEKGIIPESAVADLPLFELTSMDDTEPAAQQKATSEGKSEQKPEGLFSDLTLQEPIESESLLEPGTDDTSLAEDFDLSLGRETDASNPSPESSPEPAPKPEKETTESPDAGGLFSGIDIDAVLDSVANSASTDLQKAGIATEEEADVGKQPVRDQKATTEKQALDSRQSADFSFAGDELDLQPDGQGTSPGNAPVAKPESAAREPLVLTNTDPELKTRKKPPQPQGAPQEATRRSESSKAEDSAEAAETVAQPARSRLPADVLLFVVVGMIILGAGNWFYFKGSIEANELEQSRIQMELLRIKKAEKQRLEALEKEPNNSTGQLASTVQKTTEYTKNYQGMFQLDGLTVQARARVEAGEVEIQDFTIRTPEPRELTDMEIVEGKEKLPWLAKVAVDKVLLPLRKDNTFSEQVTIKAFIEDNHKHTRLLADGVLNAAFFPEEHRLELSLQVADGGVPLPSAGKHSIKRLETGKYSYAASGKVSLKAIPKEK